VVLYKTFVLILLWPCFEKFNSQSQTMFYHYRIRPRDLEDNILSAFAPQLSRCIVYLLYFCCIGSHLICCSLCDMEEEAGAKVRREKNLQGDRCFSDLQNMLFLVSFLAQVAKEQITVLGRFGVYICTTFWVEVNVNKVYMSQATFFLAVAAYSQYCI